MKPTRSSRCTPRSARTRSVGLRIGVPGWASRRASRSARSPVRAGFEPQLRATVATVPPGRKDTAGRCASSNDRASAVTPAMKVPSPPESTTREVPRAAMVRTAASRSARLAVGCTTAMPFASRSIRASRSGRVRCRRAVVLTMTSMRSLEPILRRLSIARLLRASCSPVSKGCCPATLRAMQRALRFAATGLVLLCQCGGSASLRAAEAGRLTGLSAVVAAEVKRGELDAAEAVELARAILRRDVAGASGDEGASRIRGLTGCARPLDGALERRAETADAAAAAAAMVRLEADLSPREDFVRWASEAPGGPRAAFRPVGARALSGADDGELRRKLFLDGDQAVRLAALRAAAHAASASDTDAVLEAARVDPFPMARIQAVRAAGAIGGERVVLALKDIWVTADPILRQAIADAWGTPASIDAGGRRELSWAVDTQGGSPAIAAAYALVRTANRATPIPTGPGVADALGVIERAMKSGVTHERTFAVTIAPLSVPALQKAVIEAS